jgi:hypothetical protein
MAGGVMGAARPSRLVPWARDPLAGGVRPAGLAPSRPPFGPNGRQASLPHPRAHDLTRSRGIGARATRLRATTPPRLPRLRRPASARTASGRLQRPRRAGQKARATKPSLQRQQPARLLRRRRGSVGTAKIPPMSRTTRISRTMAEQGLLRCPGGSTYSRPGCAYAMRSASTSAAAKLA